jgi:hypothetical protein
MLDKIVLGLYSLLLVFYVGLIVLWIHWFFPLVFLNRYHW